MLAAFNWFRYTQELFLHVKNYKILKYWNNFFKRLHLKIELFLHIEKFTSSGFYRTQFERFFKEEYDWENIFKGDSASFLGAAINMFDESNGVSPVFYYAISSNFNEKLEITKP